LMWRLRLAVFLRAEPARLARRYGYGVRGPKPIPPPIFARAPGARAGEKRPLSPLRAAGAAAPHGGVIRPSVRTPRAAGGRAGAPHGYFTGLAWRFPIAVATQPEGDLGARMLAPCDAADSSAIVIGTDCPALTPSHLREAAEVLRGGSDVVVIPADDGGYVLIG